jgi:hypothetical protein
MFIDTEAGLLNTRFVVRIEMKIIDAETAAYVVHYSEGGTIRTTAMSEDDYMAFGLLNYRRARVGIASDE